MITLVPRADTVSGRALHRIGHLLGLRSETVYSRTILLVALIQFIVLGFAVVLVWLAVTAQFRQADEQELLSAARRVQSYFASQPGVSPDLLAPRAAELTGRRIYVRPSAPGETQSGIRLVSDRGGVPDAVFFFAGGGAREVVVAGSVSFYEAGLLAARTFVVGLALAGGLMLLVMLFVVDRTIVGRIQSLTDKVEHEKSSERLPVRLDYRGDDELAILARSIEELARQVQSAEREYRHVVEDQTESICRFNGDREVTFSNRTFANLCEHPPRGHLPRLADCLDVSTRTLLEDQLAGLGPASTTAAAFTHVVRKGGSAPVWLRSTLRANFAADGSFSGGQWIASDVTTEVRAQRQLQHSERQLQALSARLMNLQDDERRRIARDLHDSTAQNLSALEMNMSVLASLASDDKTRKVADETAAISRQVCQELRNISYLLHPPLLEEEGLAFAIRWFADGFTKRNNIPVFIDLPDDFPRLSEDKETALFRIVQEALSNIYRHAGATKAWIILRPGENGEVLLEIRDNGEGLPEGFSFSKSVGVGLAGMRERMKQLGGALELDSSPYGVSVKCRLGATEPEKSFGHSRV